MSPNRANTPDDPRSDLELIDAINRGDAKAFETLYLRHREYALRIAMRFAGETNLALDAVQDSFIYFYKKFPGFSLTAKLTTFLYPVLKHNAITHKQKAQRAQGNTSEEVLNDQPANATTTTPGHPASEIHALLSRLPATQREVLMLRFVDGLSIEDIADALDIPQGTVKTRIHHAIRKLREDPATKIFFDH